MPIVSIVLPTYNGEKYISSAVDSVLKQTFLDWELIIVDDGSRDKTADIITAYSKSDARIRCIYNETNRKLPDALNVGFAEATGQYFTWISDDNLFRSNALERIYDFLKNNEDCDLVYTDFSIIDEKSEIVRQMRADTPDKLIHHCVVGPCFLYKREIYESIGGYDPNYFLVEDYEYWLRMFEKFQLRPLNEDLYLYRISNETLTAKNKIKRLEMQEKLILDYLKKTTKYSNYNKSKACFILIDNERFKEKLKFRFDLLKKCFQYSKYYFFKSLFKFILCSKRKKY